MRPGPSLGSSPLARGLRDAVDLHTLQDGIIPARAGFTHKANQTNGQDQDHPRSRGVYRCTVRNRPRFRGSSPLARGLPFCRVSGRWRDGIIPARAGFTWNFTFGIIRSPDHPRSRGVYDTLNGDYEQCAGSSPLARGLRVAGLDAKLQTGIIPARAGFTYKWKG